MTQQQRAKLRMEKISIEFPGVKALSDVDFEVETGRIHALIGANGAGKSTLMKVLSGAYNHYTGKIFIDNQEVNIRTPRDAKELGIDIVYQEVDTALIPYFDVAENIMLDVMANQMGRKQFVNWSKMHENAKDVLQRLGTQIDTHTVVEDLSLAEKQMVLIARALIGKPRFLILDEPTAPLSQKETDELFRIVKDLAKNHNVGIIFISHRLPELFEICEEITVMRNGKKVTSQPIKELTSKQVVEHMLGRKVDETHWKQKVKIGKEIFRIKNLNETNQTVKNVNLSVRAGEIVGVAGLVGAGKTELCKTVFGALTMDSGEVWLNEKRLTIKSPHGAVQQGIALIPEERRKESVLVEEPVYRNLSVANLSSFSGLFGFIKNKQERNAAKKMIKDLGIKTPHENQKVALLSGGNQQKIAIGKWLMRDADVYLFDEPTKGVDVGAKGDIFNLLGQLADMGKGIIYASSELSEILAIADRIYVMYDGAIVKELKTSATNEEEILYYSTGGS